MAKCHNQHFPLIREILELVLDALPASDVGRLMVTSCHARKTADECLPDILLRRGVCSRWSWRQVHAAEVALFFDTLGSAAGWTPGPNRQSTCNSLAGTYLDGWEPWLCFSGGTDWQGFQGGYCCVSEAGIRPAWIAFRVRIMTPALSGANLALAARQRTWGLADPVLTFNYRGDEHSQYQRCFSVQGGVAQYGDVSYACRPEAAIEAGRAYDVAVHLDWDQAEMSVFIDGVAYVRKAAFRSTAPVRYVALYNWRSLSRTAFSELVLGGSCPFKVGERDAATPAGQFAGSMGGSPHRTSSRCCARRNGPTSGPPGVSSMLPAISSRWIVPIAICLLAVALKLVSPV